MTKYRKGDYKAVCERSGMIVPSSDIVTEWNGRKVRRKYAEPRHPGDTQRIRGESMIPPWTRPIPTTDDYVTRTVWQPTADPAPVSGQIYNTAFSVSLASITDDATIRYTSNGSTPSATVGTVYTAAIANAKLLEQSYDDPETATTYNRVVIKAIAYLSTGETSTVSTFIYRTS